MIVYNVTINVEDDIHEEWLQWMKDVHIPDVMSKGIFTENHIYKVLDDEGTGSHTYAIQYLCENIQAYETYKELFAPALQKEVKIRYQEKFVAFRTLLEVIY